MSDRNDSHSPEPFAAEPQGLPISVDDTGQGRSQLELLASEFVEQTRQGLEPSIERYAIRHPALADQIREFFPLVVALEQWKTNTESERIRQNLPAEFTLERLGDCRILRELGRGGMGVIFEARQGQDNRPVAVKLLPWRYGNSLPKWRERFRKEALTISKLRHEHIVPVYGFGEHEGYCYYVMQLINGVSLDRLIRSLRESEEPVVFGEFGIETTDAVGVKNTASVGRGRRELRRDSWATFAKIGIQVAHALQYAHRRRILHHDIKPANLLLDASGSVFVTDFGIAPQFESELPGDDVRMTGTLRYMAPERLSGHTDARSDLYALGATLYELVARTPAFPMVDRLELMDAIRTTRPTTPRSISPSLPRDFETIILTAMACQPDDRYTTAAEMAADLSRFVNDRSIRAKRPTWYRRLIASWTRTRNPDSKR